MVGNITEFNAIAGPVRSNLFSSSSSFFLDDLPTPMLRRAYSRHDIEKWKVFELKLAEL